MALENATYITGLNSGNPSSTDPISQADDHIRLIKDVIKNSFPNVSGPVTATHSQLSAPFASGMIMLWAGSIATIPSGWALCDGTFGTPNLRDRFVVGAGSSLAVGAVGGSNTSSAEGSHTHTTVAAGSHNHTGTSGGTSLTIAQLPAHTHDVTGTGSNSVQGSGAQPVQPSTGTQTTSSTGSGEAHTHSISSDGSHTHTINDAASHTHTVTPPYYALAYIMKL